MPLKDKQRFRQARVRRTKNRTRESGFVIPKRTLEQITDFLFRDPLVIASDPLALRQAKEFGGRSVGLQEYILGRIERDLPDVRVEIARKDNAKRIVKKLAERGYLPVAIYDKVKRMFIIVGLEPKRENLARLIGIFEDAKRLWSEYVYIPEKTLLLTDSFVWALLEGGIDLLSKLGDAEATITLFEIPNYVGFLADFPFGEKEKEKSSVFLIRKNLVGKKLTEDNYRLLCKKIGDLTKTICLKDSSYSQYSLRDIIGSALKKKPLARIDASKVRKVFRAMRTGDIILFSHKGKVYMAMAGSVENLHFGNTDTQVAGFDLVIAPFPIAEVGEVLNAEKDFSFVLDGYYLKEFWDPDEKDLYLYSAFEETKKGSYAGAVLLANENVVVGNVATRTRPRDVELLFAVDVALKKDLENLLKLKNLKLKRFARIIKSESKGNASIYVDGSKISVVVEAGDIVVKINGKKERLEDLLGIKVLGELASPQELRFLIVEDIYEILRKNPSVFVLSSPYSYAIVKNMVVRAQPVRAFRTKSFPPELELEVSKDFFDIVKSVSIKGNNIVFELKNGKKINLAMIKTNILGNTKVSSKDIKKRIAIDELKPSQIFLDIYQGGGVVFKIKGEGVEADIQVSSQEDKSR